MKTARVADIAEQIRGVTFSKGDSVDEQRSGYLPVLTASNITETGLKLDSVLYIPELKIGSRQRIQKNDVLITASSGSLSVVGRAVLVRDQVEAGFGAFCKVLRPGPEVDPNYFAHFFRTPQYRADVSRLAAGANINNLRNEDLDEFLLPLPPLPEQRRIADILDRADNLRAQRRRVIALCAELVDATFVDAFGKNPVAKATAFPLEEVVTAGTTVTYGIVQAGDEVTGGVPYIRTGDLVDGYIDQERLRRTSPEIAARFPRSRVKSGEIVMSIRATVGTTAVVPPSLDGANLTQGTARISPGESVLTEYLLAYLRSAAAQNWLQAQVKGATFREITLGRLRQMPIPVPELGLQQKFRLQIQSLELVRAQQNTHLAKLDELFASLQHRAFQGEL